MLVGKKDKLADLAFGKIANTLRRKINDGSGRSLSVEGELNSHPESIIT